jgi:hypothetical protein
MANFDSSIYTAQASAITNSSADAPNLKQTGGNVQMIHATITLTSATADADLLRICYLPATAKVIPSLSKVQCHADPGTTLVLDIGISTNTDLFADGIVLSSGGAVSFDSNVCLQSRIPERLSAETLVYATIPTSGAGTVTDGSLLTFWIAYTLG